MHMCTHRVHTAPGAAAVAKIHAVRRWCTRACAPLSGVRARHMRVRRGMAAGDGGLHVHPVASATDLSVRVTGSRKNTSSFTFGNAAMALIESS